ncbi:hypothetical protein L873DRAFT_1805230 [Choiromyces venosus 120613-1]|uniref:Uncharacterized protein n=1 Tax=Choiromyces venosus 120613-1 TaxID=1336337 RepID=A0A3N4JTP7_9PEZI|nr:hypothetical protein L873DRAFT_1805230 [Choiromyces venosus 120613-1]
MAEPNHASTTSSSTSSTDSSHPEPNSLTSFSRNDQQPVRVFGDLRPWIFILPSIPSVTLPTDCDVLPVMAEPRAGTLAFFELERDLALAMNAPLESNLTAKEVSDAFQSGEVPISDMKKRMARAKKRKLPTAHERSEISGSKNQLISEGPQTGGVTAGTSEGVVQAESVGGLLAMMVFRARRWSWPKF